MQPEQFLVNKDGEKRKILEVLNNLIAIENPYNLPGFVWMKKNEALTDGWSLLEEPWVLKKGMAYYSVTSDGAIYPYSWDDDSGDTFKRLTGNVHRTTAEAKLYRQKLIERMGKKEN